MTIDKALNILVEYNVPEHIIHHSFKVTKVAYILSEELSDVGIKVNLPLIIFSSLLHDITKYQSILNKGEDHSETGGKVLRDIGYPDVAEIIESHIVIKNRKRLLIEKMVVFYADKRVMHDKVVSLKERYEDLAERYGKNFKSKLMIKEGYRRAMKIEREIFKSLNFSPLSLNIL